MAQLTKDPLIRSVYVPSESQMEVLRFTYQRFYQMRDKRKDFEGDWDKWEKQWNSYRPPKDADDWRSNIYIPMTTSVIEAQLAEVIDQDLMPFVVERGAEDASKAEVINAILQYTWEQAKSNVALIQMMKDALIFGTGIGMEYYWKQPRTVKTESGGEKKILEYDDCYLEPVRLWDFFIDEAARGFSGPFGARDCVRRYIMDIDDFRTFFTGEWDPFNAAQYVKPGGDINYYEFYKPPEKLIKDREVEVLWYWNKPLDKLSIVANDVLVVDKPNPYKHKQLPFVRVIDVLRPYQFYGKGECELMESLQEETNTLRRMTIDRNHLDIDKPILVSDTLTLEDEDLIARPHGAISVSDVNGAKPLEYGDIPRSVFDQLTLLNEDKVRVTGMDERQQSVSTAGTATEAAILKEATLKRLNAKLFQIKEDTLIDLGRLRVENIMQFYSQPKLEAIIGDDKVQKAQAAGNLIKVDGKNYQKTYRNVRLKDQALQVNNANQPQIVNQNFMGQQIQGYTFFEAKPEFFLPTHGGYDVRYKATSSLPVSKPLMMQKADEMYDRLIQNPAVDPWKLAQYLIKSREENPDNFQRGAPQGQAAPPINLQKAIDLAGVENQEMMQGNPISPTPYAPVPHTEVHIQFMQSDNFKKSADQKTLQIFANHVTGEIAAQHQREAVGSPGNTLGQPSNGVIGGTGPGAAAPGPGQVQPNGVTVGANMQTVNPGQSMGAGDVNGVAGGQPSGMTGQ